MATEAEQAQGIGDLEEETGAGSGVNARRDRLVGELRDRILAYNPDPKAPVREICSHLGDKWSKLLLLILNCGTFRYSDLKRTMGDLSFEGNISQRMLSMQLRALERDGLVARFVLPTVPPQVSYALSPMGKQLSGLILALIAFIEERLSEVEQARAAFDHQQADHV